MLARAKPDKQYAVGLCRAVTEGFERQIIVDALCLSELHIRDINKPVGDKHARRHQDDYEWVRVCVRVG